MYQTIKHRLTIGATTLLFIASACSNDSDDGDSRDKRAANDDAFEGVAVAGLPLLAAGCTIVTTGTAPVMTVIVKDGESALITLRPSDNMVTVNGHVFMGATDTNAPCDIAPSGTISVIADQAVGAVLAPHMLGRTVILDYINGLFMTAASATTPPIKIDFSTMGDGGGLNQLKIRGSDGADQFAVGAGTGVGAAAVFAFNANAKWGVATSQAGGTGGGAVALDAFADVTFKLLPTVMMSTGAGDDRLDAEGLGAIAGVGTAFPNALKLYGGDGIDTITGGLAGDTLSGGAGADVLNGCQGDDTYDMGSALGGADLIVQVCPPPTPAVVPPVSEGSDTVDFSKRTGGVTVNLSKTLTAATAAAETTLLSGEGLAGAMEGAHISDKIATLKMGSGDDIVKIPAASTVSHKVQGGPGDDTMAGGGVSDTFDGEGGDDTCTGTYGIMSYAARTVAITVTTCGTDCTPATDANDGDQSVTGSSHSGTNATTAAAGGITLATVTGTGFTPASVGNTLTLTGCMVGADNAVAGFPIVAVSDDGLVAKIDVTSVGMFATSSMCNYSEARSAPLAANAGAASAVSAPVVSATVTGLDHLANVIGHKIALTSTTATVTDDGVFHIVGVNGAGNTASIDKTTRPDGSAVTGFTGGVSGMNWVETGNEHDNVQCASVLAGTGADTITGDARANNFRGGSGADILNGGAGSDTLTGEGGGDSLYGGPGDDTLVGGGGNSTSTGSAPTLDANDNLFGGDGNDVLEGDTGADLFTCDGRNSSTVATLGMAPGDSDITVDKVAATDSGGADCEF
jgi:hypothetical protein